VAIQFNMVGVVKMRTTACGGNAVAWILRSEFFQDAEYIPRFNYCILVQPASKQDCLEDLDGLTPEVPELDCAFPLEEWLDSLPEEAKDASFYICLDLPPFSKSSSSAIDGLLTVIARNTPRSRPTIYGVSPNLRNWLSLPVQGFIQSEFNASELAGVQVTKFLAAHISPFAMACIDPMELEDVLRIPDNPAILLQGIWDCDTGKGLQMSASDLEIVRGSSDIVAVSAVSPFHLSASRLFWRHLRELATYAEYIHVMDHSGILQNPAVPYTKGDVPVHLLCRKVRWGTELI
jgi:hypothetical protein